MALTGHARNLTISYFTSTHGQTIHRKVPNSFQIPSLIYCRKTLLTKKFLIQRQLNTKMWERRRIIMLIRNTEMRCNKTFAEKSVSRLTIGEWKSCFYNQKLLFKHKSYSNKTTSYLKSVSSETLTSKLLVLRFVPPYSNISKKCLLCL